MSKTIAQKVVDFVGASAELIRRGNTALEKSASAQQAITALIPQVQETLVAQGKIKPHEKEAAAHVLMDHEKTLQLLMRVATSPEIAPLGREEKAASDNRSYNSIGGIVPVGDTNAGRRMAAALLGANR